MAEKIYPKGFVSFAKHASAPDYVLGSMIISINDFIDWLKTDGLPHLTEYNGKKQLRLTITQGKERISIHVDTWKPKSPEEKAVEKSAPKESGPPSDDLPF